MKYKNHSRRLILYFAFVITTLNAWSQNGRECLAEVIQLEKTGTSEKDSVLEHSSIYMNYMVRATTWDDEATISNVKMYKRGYNMHFFSEQANIYTDEDEILIVMPYQKMLVINTNIQAVNKQQLTDDFYETRKAFLDSCIVVKCETKSDNNKILVLKAGRYTPDESIKISSMVYEYNTATKKILSVKVNYTNDYKLKQLAVFYKEFSSSSNYKFPSFKSQVIDRKGRVKEKYKGYEVVDNREKKDKSH